MRLIFKLALMARASWYVLGIFIWKLQFFLRARVASKREVYLDRLLYCVGHEFFESGEISGIQRAIVFQPGYDTDENNKRISGICWEAPIVIIVHFNGKPLVGMGAEFRGPHLYIQQLQGVPGASIPDSLHKWPALLVKGAMNFLYNTEEFRSVRIVAADQRYVYASPVFEGDPLSPEEYDKKRKVHQRRLRRRYDGTARQMGFKKLSPRYWEWTREMIGQ